MSKGTTSFRIKEENAIYFLTCATVEWIDVFTKRRYKELFVESLNFCIENKGLVVYGWVLMSNHFHLIVRAKDDFQLSGIIRDMKKFITNEVVKQVKEYDSRKSWLLLEMRKSGLANSKKQKYQLWRNDNHPIQLINPEMIMQKLGYIHYNPVKESIVEYPEEYIHSSAKDYAGMKGLVAIKSVHGYF